MALAGIVFAKYYRTRYFRHYLGCMLGGLPTLAQGYGHDVIATAAVTTKMSARLCDLGVLSSTSRIWNSPKPLRT